MTKNEIFEYLKGSTVYYIEGLEEGSSKVTLQTSKGALVFEHWQDCCETVTLNDFELDNNINSAEILSIEEVVKEGDPSQDVWDYESSTWTFYKIETSKGGLWMRWFGESNGYYSEAVDLTLTIEAE